MLYNININKLKRESYFMGYGLLAEKERTNLKEYIAYARQCVSQIKAGKKKNLEVLGEAGEDFPEPGIVLKRVPLDSPRGEYKYFKKSAELFSRILKEGKITNEQALDLRLNESFEQPDFL